jgi:hypothetical protein
LASKNDATIIDLKLDDISSMVTDRYLQFLAELKSNNNIKIIDHLTNSELKKPLESALKRRRESLLEKNVILKDEDLVYFQLGNITVAWEGKVTPSGETALDGGFVMNGLTDALLFPYDFWKAPLGIAPGKEVPEELKHYERLGWFERRPDGMDDKKRGCFIRQEGPFPPPIAFYTTGGWYTSLSMSYEEYLNLMFENFAFRGWQFFYIEIPAAIPHLNDILEEMRVAVKLLPLHFPDKDWSFHASRYDEVVKKLRR